MRATGLLTRDNILVGGMATRGSEGRDMNSPKIYPQGGESTLRVNFVYATSPIHLAAGKHLGWI
ncbi:hypothetical protein GIB67_010208 [Kingdonia uniflora]|uniref:Uncharacterized protein n=1 Tax=Kingdonia uniflora TaxID=39325 RepID=A0A7J7NBK8_9MAGN|nr:hypothetical protein GIB67_010208 [Kingdonia uniflora]